MQGFPTATDCIGAVLSCQTLDTVRQQRIEADFSCGTISSNDGILLAGLAEQRLNLFDQLGECFRHTRSHGMAVRSCRSLAGQRVLDLLLGCEGPDDREELRKDPAIVADFDRMDQQLVGLMAETHPGWVIRGVLLRQGDAENRVMDLKPGLFASTASPICSTPTRCCGSPAPSSPKPGRYLVPAHPCRHVESLSRQVRRRLEVAGAQLNQRNRHEAPRACRREGPDSAGGSAFPPADATKAGLGAGEDRKDRLPAAGVAGNAFEIAGNPPGRIGG